MDVASNGELMRVSMVQVLCFLE